MMPISFTRLSTNGNPEVGFAFSDYGNGNVGIWDNIFIGGASDFSCQASYPFASPGSFNTLCSWHNRYNEADYMAATDSAGQGTTIWRISFNVGAILNTVVQYPSTYAHLWDMGCANNVTAVMRTNGLVNVVHATNGALGQKVFNKTLIGTVNPNGNPDVFHSIALSNNNRVMAFLNGTVVTVARATDGGLVGNLVPTDGLFMDVQLSDAGNVAWILTTTGLDRFDLLDNPTFAENLPKDPAGNTILDGTEPCGGATCTIDDNGNINTVPGSSTAPPSSLIGDFDVILPGFNKATSMILFTVITVVLMALLGWALTAKNPSGYIIGGLAGLGYIASKFLWKAPLWPIVILAIVAIAIIFMRAKFGAGSSQ
jgi:hypothetical protein